MDKEEYLPVLILERTLCFFSQFTIILGICLCGHDYTRVFLSILASLRLLSVGVRLVKAFPVPFEMMQRMVALTSTNCFLFYLRF